MTINIGDPPNSGTPSGVDGVKSVTGDLVDNTDIHNPVIQKRARVLIYSLTDISIGSDSTNPSFLTPVFLGSAEGISLEEPDGTIKNNTGRKIDLAGTISYNPDKGGGGVVTLHLVTESSSDDGVTWVGNAYSHRSVEISNSGESFGTKLAMSTDWEPDELIRFRSWITSGTLSFVSTDINALGQTFTTPSVVWELSEV